MDTKNIVQELTLAEGTQNGFNRQARDGSLIVAHGLPRFAEHATRGRLFMMDSDAVTLAAANATKGALATVKLINGFFNPVTSGKNAILLRAKVATTSGTPAGPYFFNYLDDSTISSAATGTIRSSRLDQPATSAMRAQTGVVVTNAAGGTTALKQLGVLGGPAAVAAGAGMYQVEELIDGGIVVPPGYLFGLTCVGAGTTHIVQSTLYWLELPV